MHHHVAKDRRSVSVAFHFAHKIHVLVELGEVLIGGCKDDDAHAWTQSDQTAQCVALDLVLLCGLAVTMVLLNYICVNECRGQN